LLRADAAGGDVGLEVVFTFDGGVGEGGAWDLADVIEGVSDRALEESSAAPWSGSPEAK